MQKKRKVLCFVVALCMVAVLMLACTSEKPAESSEAPVESSEAPVESSEAPVESSEAPVESESTEASGDIPREVSKAYGSKSVGDTLSFGVILMNVQDEYFAYVSTGSERFMEDTGFEVTVVDGAGLPERQVQGIESLVQKGVDGIELRAIDGASVIDALANAKNAGVATAVYPEAAEGADIYMLYDEYDFGYQLAAKAAEWAKEKHPDEVINVGYNDYPENADIMVRCDGFTDALNDILGPQGEAWELIGQSRAQTGEEGMTNMENWLQMEPDMHIVLAVGDTSGLGANEAAKSAGMTADDIWIGGINADEAAIAAIAAGEPFQGTMATDYLPPEGTYVMLQLLANYVYGLGWNDLIVSPLAITSENVNSYERGFFYDTGEKSPFEQKNPDIEFALPAS